MWINYKNKSINLKNIAMIDIIDETQSISIYYKTGNPLHLVWLLEDYYLNLKKKMKKYINKRKIRQKK